MKLLFSFLLFDIKCPCYFFPQVFNINNVLFYTLQLQDGLNDFKVVKYEQLRFSQQVKTMQKKQTTTLKSVCLDVTKIISTLFITACICFVLVTDSGL